MESALLRQSGYEIRVDIILAHRPFNHASQMLNERPLSIHVLQCMYKLYMWSIVSSLARSLTSRVKSSYASVLTELRQKYAPTNAQVRCVRLPAPAITAHFLGSFGKLLWCR